MTISDENAMRTAYRRASIIPESFKPVQVNDYTPAITHSDIDNGVITRYFVRPSNTGSPSEIIEVSPPVFNQLNVNNFYTTTSLQWLIRGTIDTTHGLTEDGTPIILQYGVPESNQRSVLIADEDLPGLSIIVTNYLRFYQGL